MSNGNRVEELESTVSELEATVRGLTEELVEANERIRQLEGATDVEAASARTATDGESEDDLPEFAPRADHEDVQRAAVEADNRSESQGENEDDADETGLDDDIIVA